jgi:hypothetical protein
MASHCDKWLAESLRFDRSFASFRPAAPTVRLMHPKGLSEPILLVARIDEYTGMIRSMRIVGIRALAAAGRRKAAGGGEV